MFASYFIWRQHLLLFHISNVLARLEPYANKTCHFDNESLCLGLCVNCLENVEFAVMQQSSQSRKTVHYMSYF